MKAQPTKINDLTNGDLEKAIKLSRKLKNQSLIKCLQRLKKINHLHNYEHFIYSDFAPYSFYFIRKLNNKYIMNGGIIFHGSHDNFGSGSTPTFSVTLEKTKGWKIHT
jgi:hypothetical protein